jgi:hypothetical protein
VSAALTAIYAHKPLWTSDSAGVILVGSDGGSDRMGFYRVDVRTGATKPLLFIRSSVFGYAQCAPNGRDFFYVDETHGIIVHDLTSGAQHAFAPGPAVVPDGPFVLIDEGRSLAFVQKIPGVRGHDGSQPDDVYAIVVQHQGDRPREIHRFAAGTKPILQAWLRRTGELIYLTASNMRMNSVGATTDNPRSVWRIALAGGVPQQMHFTMDDGLPTPLSLSPDGHQLAYSTRTVVSELWITKPGWDASQDR